MKLHASLLDDYKFSLLEDGEKYQIIAIWLLATQLDNKIPDDEKWLAKRIGSLTVNVSRFIELKFLASTLPTSRKQSAPLETEAKAKTEDKDTIVISKKNGELKKTSKENMAKIPYQKIVDLYHRMLPTLPQCKKITATRKSYIRGRWLEDEMNTAKQWENFFIHVSQSNFLMGRREPTPGYKKMLANLAWITKPENFVKILEGEYHRD